MLDWMDITVEPCDDFYNFACGNFAETVISTDKEMTNILFILDDNMQKKLCILLNKIDSNDPAPFIMAKKLYKACMNITRIEEQGL